MTDAKRDNNYVTTLIGVSSADGVTPVTIYVDPTTHRVLVQIAAGSGTVTSVSVVSANGFAGTVATATTTPAITISTTVTGVLKGNGTAISAATAGTDYTTPTGTENLQNKTLDNTNVITVKDANFTLQDDGGTTRQAQFQLSGITAGQTRIVTLPDSNTTLPIASQVITFSGPSTARTYTFPDASDTVVTLAASQTLTNKTLTTPVLNGTPTGTGVATAATVSTLALRDANGNLTAVNHIEGFTTTVTASQTTTLTVSSNYLQYFTGSTAGQIIQLPVATTLVNGQQFLITNTSSVTIAVQTSGTNALITIGASCSALITCVNTAGGTGTASWQVTYYGMVITSAKVLTVSNSLTLAGTDGKTLTLTNSLTVTTNDGTLAFGAASKTLTVNNSLTLAGTDSTTMTFPSTTATIARTDAAQTFTGTQTFSQIVTTNNAITASGNAATVPITSRLSTVTNNSAATLTITITTASAVDGQMVIVRILDFSAAAQTITWVNTENSTVTAPTTSNGSTTLPLTVGFMYNAGTSKWRCIASA